MTQGETSASHSQPTSRWAWLLRVCLALGIIYSSYAVAFYAWYASFPGPNQGNATIVANIWSVVAVACLAALVASFFRRKPRGQGRPG